MPESNIKKETVVSIITLLVKVATLYAGCLCWTEFCWGEVLSSAIGFVNYISFALLLLITFVKIPSKFKIPLTILLNIGVWASLYIEVISNGKLLSNQYYLATMIIVISIGIQCYLCKNNINNRI